MNSFYPNPRPTEHTSAVETRTDRQLNIYIGSPALPSGMNIPLRKHLTYIYQKVKNIQLLHPLGINETAC